MKGMRGKGMEGRKEEDDMVVYEGDSTHETPLTFTLSSGQIPITAPPLPGNLQQEPCYRRTDRQTGRQTDGQADRRGERKGRREVDRNARSGGEKI